MDVHRSGYVAANHAIRTQAPYVSASGAGVDHTVTQKPSRKGKPGPKPKPKKIRPDLSALYGIEPWTPHECRTTVTTFLDDRRLGGAATAILGHKTDHDRVDSRERMATITEQHYNRSQRIGLKAEGMALWAKTLLAAYAKESRKFRDMRPGRIGSLTDRGRPSVLPSKRTDHRAHSRADGRRAEPTDGDDDGATDQNETEKGRKRVLRHPLSISVGMGPLVLPHPRMTIKCAVTRRGDRSARKAIRDGCRSAGNH